MKWSLLLPLFLVLFGAWLWQDSVLNSLREREKSLRLALNRRAAAPVPTAVSLTIPSPPDAGSIARSLLAEYRALLPASGRRSTAEEIEARSHKEEELAEQPPEVLRQLLSGLESSGLSRAESLTLRQSLLRTLAATDPATCVRFAAARPRDNYLASSLSGWLRKWAARDAAGAQEWFDSVKAGSGFKDFALDDLDQLKDNELSLRVQMLSGWAAGDSAGFDFHEVEGLHEDALFRFSADTPNELKQAALRAQYAQRIWSEVTDARVAEKLLSLAATVWSKRVPFAELQSLTDSLQASGPLTPEKQKVLSEMRAAVFQYGGGVPDAATFAWALQAAGDPDLRARIIDRMVTGWMSADHNRTGTLLNSLPPGPDRDHAAVTFARRIMAQDEAASLAWAASISDPALREKTETGLRKGMGK